MRKNVGKKIRIMLGVIVVCVTAFWILYSNNVFGQFIPDKPYVTDAPQGNTSALTAVTYEGGNQKGSLGSGATPMPGVPIAGKDEPKGSEKNPFVLLEIVPEHAQQQMVYLNTSDKNYPLDVLQIGIEASRKEQKDFINFRDVTNFGLHNSPGEWFCRYKYNLYKFGEDEKTVSKPLVEIGKVYSLDIEREDLQSKYGIDPAEFDQYFNENGECKDIKSLIEKYPDLFRKDKNGEEIRNIALKDNRNWRANKGKSIQYEVASFTTDDLSMYRDYQYYVNVSEIMRENPDLFRYDKKGNEISDAVRNDMLNWKGECTKTDSYDYKVVTTDISEEDYEAYHRKEMSMKELSEKYPNLFRKDIEGKEIDESRLSAVGWDVHREVGKLFPTVLKSGYVQYVGDGGEYEIGEDSAEGMGTFLALSEKENGAWKYSEDLPEGVEENKDYWRFANKEKGYCWSISSLEEGHGSHKVAILEKANVCTFRYKRNISSFEFIYDKIEKSDSYSIDYYGLKGNDILKRSLFTFQDEEESKNFNLQVIAMTPSEINEAVKEDTAETLDIIERADLFYFGLYDSATDNITQVYDLYNKYVKDEKEKPVSSDNIKDYYGNDLDWSSCYKILVRLCNNSNLPLIWTQKVGEMLNYGVDGTNNTHMYITGDITAKHVEAMGSLNNIAKLYLLTLQFDMLARKGEGEVDYKRTFYNDILNNLQTIELNLEAMEKASKDTASTTGYYERKLVETNCDGTVLTGSEIRDPKWKTCNYLWNLWTFYPSDIKLGAGNEMAENRDSYIQYGYLDSFFDSNADPFRDNVAGHHSGSDGYDGKNVGIVHGESSNSNVNQSTLLGSPNDGGSILNTTLNVAYQIMNKQTPKVDPLKVKVERRKRDYQKLSDELILIDYSKNSNQDVSGKEPIYIKLTISNTNNEDGILKSIHLMKDTGDVEKKVLLPQKKDKTALVKEKILDVNGKQPVEGYRIPANGTLTFYIPYHYSQWKQDYTQIQLVMRGRKYLLRKGKKESTLGSKVEHTVTISERSLFDLE